MSLEGLAGSWAGAALCVCYEPPMVGGPLSSPVGFLYRALRLR